MKTAVVLLVLLMATLGFAQPPQLLWSINVQEDHGVSLQTVQALPGGDLLAGGSCCLRMCHMFATEAFVTRLNSQGGQIWTFGRWGCYGNLGESGETQQVRLMSDGGSVLLCNVIFPAIGELPVLVRTDAAGNVLWDRTLEDPPSSFSRARCFVPTADQGYVMLIDSTIVVCTDSLLHPLWTRTDSGRALFDLTATTDGGWIAAGTADAYRSALYAMKLNAEGDTVWTRNYDIGLGGHINRAHVLPDGNILLAGSVAIADAPQPFYGGYVVIDNQGTVIRQHVFFEGQNDSGLPPFLDIADCREGGMIALNGPNPGWSSAYALVRMNAVEDTLWTETISSSGTFGSLAQTADSGYAIVGTDQEAGVILKYSKEGLAADNPFILQPSSFRLSAYPNPFNPSTTLAFTLPKSGFTMIDVYDLAGRKVQTLADGLLEAGEHRLTFNGSQLPSGIYFARLQSGEFSASRKLLLLK